MKVDHQHGETRAAATLPYSPGSVLIEPDEAPVAHDRPSARTPVTPPRAWNAVPSVESVPSPHLTPVRELFADADEDDDAAPARSVEPPPPGHSAPSRPPEAPAAADASAAIAASPCAASFAAAALDLVATIHPPPRQRRRRRRCMSRGSASRSRAPGGTRPPSRRTARTSRSPPARGARWCILNCAWCHRKVDVRHQIPKIPT